MCSNNSNVVAFRQLILNNEVCFMNYSLNIFIVVQLNYTSKLKKC